jgi:DNA-directed RNA polymerase III subunit RPC6
MASASTAEPFPVPPPVKEEDAPTIEVNLTDLLYDKCAEAPQGTVFFQRELSNMQVANTMTELTMLLQNLCDRHLMKLMTFDNEPCWKLRSKTEAEK